MFRLPPIRFARFPASQFACKFWLVGLVLLAGCASRGELAFLDDAEIASPSIASHRIFVATSRSPANDVTGFSAGRSQNLSFARYSVSVPPGHKSGKIEWPAHHADQKKHFVTTGVETFKGPSEFVANINKEVANTPISQRDAIVYVHGYNTNFAEGLYRLVQMTNDLKKPAVTIHYSWPSAGKALGYLYDRDSVLTARDGLEKLLINVANSSVEQVILVAHSMGGQLAVETLRQISIRNNNSLKSKLAGVFLIAPDIDEQVFLAQIKSIRPLPQPFFVFVSDNDKALKLSSFIAGGGKRVGSVTQSAAMEDQGITLVDTSKFNDGDPLNHLTSATSPTLISLVKKLSKRALLIGSLTKTEFSFLNESP